MHRRCLKCSTTISVCILRFCVHVIVSSVNFSPNAWSPFSVVYITNIEWSFCKMNICLVGVSEWVCVQNKWETQNLKTWSIVRCFGSCFIFTFSFAPHFLVLFLKTPSLLRWKRGCTLDAVADSWAFNFLVTKIVVPTPTQNSIYDMPNITFRNCCVSASFDNHLV